MFQRKKEYTVQLKDIDDDYIFPFGKHIGLKIGEVPADYLDYISGQAWIEKYPQIVRYIEKNRKYLDMELKRMKKI